MTNRRIAHLDHTWTDIPIAIVAEQLSLPIKTILHLASDGYIPLFIRTQWRQVRYVSIHVDRVNPLSTNVTEHTVNDSTIGVTGLDDEGVIGFFLSNDDCRELVYKRKICRSFFPSAVRKRFAHLKQVHPTPSFLAVSGSPELAPDGWRVACFSKEDPPIFGVKGNNALLQEFDITSNNLYARKEDIEAFIDVIDSNSFLTDLLVEEQGQASDSAKIAHVVDEKPAYVSKKLVHLIETSERFWYTRTPIDPKDYEARREKSRLALQDREFRTCFDKGTPSEGVIAAALQFIEPVFARAKAPEAIRQAWSWYLTPELLVLLAASKLYWSPPYVDLDEVATHPKNSAIEAYLCSRGIQGNHANYAMTLIRPEGAARGRPVPTSPAPHLLQRRVHAKN